MICHRVVVCSQASRPRAYIAPSSGCRAPLTRQTGPAPSASRPSTPPTGPVSKPRTTRRTPSSASWSRTAGRSSRTGRPAWTAPAASPSSTAFDAAYGAGFQASDDSPHRRGLPVIGYVKTHHRRMLAREHWVRVPELTAGERSGLFAMKDALYGCYLRVGDPGPWAGPWAGIARLEMPSGIGRDAAVEAAERAAGWLPVFASALHRDARAPVNLTPIAGLERHLHRLQGDARLALRAVREAVLERNREGPTA